MRAEVHLTAYKQRIVPVIHATWSRCRPTAWSTRRATSPISWRVSGSTRPSSPSFPTYVSLPGMPATVMMPAESRTAFAYVVGPLVMSFNKAFRQK